MSHFPLSTGGKSNCGICAKKVHRNDSGILCDGCDVWFHGNCIALSDEQLNILAPVATSCWFCQPCFDQRKYTTPVKGWQVLVLTEDLDLLLLDGDNHNL